jgi:hypothetical protein
LVLIVAKFRNSSVQFIYTFDDDSILINPKQKNRLAILLSGFFVYVQNFTSLEDNDAKL